jgi:integrase/recombinase XerD
MINQIIANIQQDLSQILTENQMEALSKTLVKHLSTLSVDKAEVESSKPDLLPLFIAAKRVEGCSEKSLRYPNPAVEHKKFLFHYYTGSEKVLFRCIK